MKRKERPVKALYVFLFVLLLTFGAVAPQAEAGSIELVFSSHVGMTWTYDAYVSATSTTLGGWSELVMYDIPQYLVGTAGTSAPGWSLAGTPMTGPVPYLQAPVDDPTAVNLHFTYAGGPVAGPAYLGQFWFDSLGVDMGALVLYAAQDINTAREFKQGNSGYTPGPSAVPEPATYALMGAGLLWLGHLRRRRG